MRIVKFVSAIVLIALISACSPSKEQSISSLEKLVAEASAQSADYSADDWCQFLEEYHTLDSLLSTQDLTEAEREQVGRLKGKCAGYIVKANAAKIQKQIEGAAKEAKGALDGFIDALKSDE